MTCLDRPTLPSNTPEAQHSPKMVHGPLNSAKIFTGGEKMTNRYKSRTSWREKLEKDHPNHGKVVDVPPKMQKRFGRGTMLIPRPLDVDALISKVPKGKLVTVSQLMEKSAKDEGTDSACPMTTGIFIRIVAETAEEDLLKGRKRITPYWRMIKTDGTLNPKYPGGVKAQRARLKEEGQSIVPARGKRPPKVGDFEQCLCNL